MHATVIYRLSFNYIVVKHICSWLLVNDEIYQTAYLPDKTHLSQLLPTELDNVIPFVPSSLV